MSSAGPADDHAAVRRRIVAMQRRQAPDNELPVSVAFDALLGQAHDVVVFLCGAAVYSTGIGFRITAVARTADDRRAQELSGPMFGHAGEDVFLFGVEFADHRRATLLPMGGFDLAKDDGQRPMLMRGGGSGGDRRSEITLFLSPLPPPGPVRLVAAWPARGISETVVELDSAPLITAASRVRTLWELEPYPLPPTSPTPSPVPPGGWFEAATRERDD